MEIGAGSGVVSSGATSCTPCGGGCYSASSTSVCTSCRANSNTQGVTGSQSKSTCVCRPGFTRDGDIDANPYCTACSVNTYKTVASNSACSTCAAGSIAENGAGNGIVSSGATSCTACGGGTYSASSTSVCTSCPANSNTQGCDWITK